MSTHIPARWEAEPGQQAAARRQHGGGARSRLDRVPRPRRVPYLILGVLLVLACVTGAVAAGFHLGDRQAVLILARPVTVGHVLTKQDIRETSLTKNSRVAAIRADEAARVTGRPMAYSLPRGALLSEDVVGRPRIPPAGEAMAAVALKGGQFPSGLQAGNRVQVVAAPESGTGSEETQSQAWAATVTAVKDQETEQTTVVSLQLDERDARRLAAAPEGRISVVMVHGGAR